MLSRRQWGLSMATLLFAVSVPVAAQRPIDSVCTDMRSDIDYYHNLWMEGGTPKQMEVWRKIYIRNMWRYGNAACPAYVPARKIKKALAASDKEINAKVLTGRRPIAYTE